MKLAGVPKVVSVRAPRRKVLAPDGPTYSKVPALTDGVTPVLIGELPPEKSATRRPPPTNTELKVVVLPVSVVVPAPIWRRKPGPLMLFGTVMFFDRKK